jgi:hypothetical protein
MMTFDHTFTYQDFSCEVALLEGAEMVESEEKVITPSVMFAKKNCLWRGFMRAIRNKKRKK